MHYSLQSTAMIDIVANFTDTQRRIHEACLACGRSVDAITLLAVSKSQSASQIAALFAAGQQHFGENYLQEALPKLAELALLEITWHFIGTIQAKKTPEIAKNFSWVHTVCRFKEAALLSLHRTSELPPLNICLQVKMDNNPDRNGLLANELPTLIERIQTLPNLRVRGLMVLPPFVESQAEQRHYFHKLQKLFTSNKHLCPEFDTLSMGMTHDLEAAILEGATMVRIGTGIFGPRRKSI